jgi:hypothetical protein
MKLKTITLVILTVFCGFIIDGLFNLSYSYQNGAPSGRSGSISGSSTCTSCHSGGTNAIQPGWITSTVPASGYVPGTTYTVTATCTYAGRSMFGFEMTPENSTGTKKGTIIVTNTTTTQTISAGRYITHKTAGTTGTAGSHTWSFNWTAPAAGSGTITFYGAFLCANGNNSSSGDATYKANLAVNEDLIANVLTENSTGRPAVSVFPNPVSDHLNVNYKINHQGMVEIKLFDLRGRVIESFLSEIKSPGDYQNDFKIPFNLNAGVYFLEIATETGNTTTRVLVQQ